MSSGSASTPPASSKKRVSTDAFSLLMMTTVGKKQQTKDAAYKKKVRSSFVLCPGGCGRSLLKKDINRHLDECLGADDRSLSTSQQSQSSATTTTFAEMSQSQRSSSPISSSQEVLPNDNYLQNEKGRVRCPVCEKSLPKKFINLHLDQCTTAATRKGIGSNGPKRKVSNEESPRNQAKGRESQIGYNVREALGKPLNFEQSPSRTESLPAKNLSENHVDTDTIREVEMPVTSEGPSYSPCKSAQDINAHESMITDRSIDHEARPEAQNSVAIAGAEPAHESKPVASKNNAFATMMKHSKTVFAKPSSTAPVSQTLHYEDGVALVCQNTFMLPEFQLNRRWFSAVLIKDKLGTERRALEFDVTLSSSVPSCGAPSDTAVRWVRHHSRLSVPVLKSILQKAIRRRRPLPAVRVAMEIADKSLGELLRRLPIIVLEDSTLHPDFNFLMWIMMAHSKAFVPPPRLLMRVFQIIFEVASCPWSDFLTPLHSDGADNPATTASAISLTLLYEASFASDSSSVDRSSPGTVDESLLWSILVRAEYGGMKGDVLMLRRYAQLWKERLDSSDLPADVATRVFPQSSCITRATWRDVPMRIHQDARDQGIERVSVLCSNGIDRLTMHDISVEGVDFHCSNILDELIADRQLTALCLDLLILADVDNIPSSDDGRRAHLEEVLKSCMWRYSSGVNRRRPLYPDSGVLPASDDNYKELWTDLVAPKAHAYQRSYVNQRLA